MPDLHYVYGIVPAPLDLRGIPSGLDDTVVIAIGDASLAALVSRLDENAYGDMDTRISDLEWLGPRAHAHDAVVTWAADRGAVVPLPMFSIFRDEARVREMLVERHAQVVRALARVAPGREYGVRVFRIDAEVEKGVGALSPRVAELERQAREASPGQGYLIGRKLEGERRSEARRIGGDVARETFERLSARVLAAATDALPTATSEAAGTAILNAAFLVPRDALEPFREELTQLVAQYEPVGFRFDFTGPWPPYHFVEDHA